MAKARPSRGIVGWVATINGYLHVHVHVVRVHTIQVRTVAQQTRINWLEENQVKKTMSDLKAKQVDILLEEQRKDISDYKRLPGGGPPWFWVCCREPNSCLILSEKSGCLIKSSVDWSPEAP